SGDAAVVGRLHRLHLAHAHGHVEPAFLAAADLGLGRAQRAGAGQQALGKLGEAIQPLLAVVVARDVVHLLVLCKSIRGSARRRRTRAARAWAARQFMAMRVESRPSERVPTPCADATKKPANSFPPAAASSAARRWACWNWRRSWPACP